MIQILSKSMCQSYRRLSDVWAVVTMIVCSVHLIIHLVFDINVCDLINLMIYLCHLHTFRHMSYVYLQIFLTRQGNTSTIEAIFFYCGCDRVVQGAGHKAKRLVLQCINGVGSNPVEGRTKKNLTALKSNSNTVWFNLIYMSEN